MTTTFLERVEHVLAFLLKLVGPLFVIFATLLIGSIAVVHFVIILPTLISPTDKGGSDIIEDSTPTSHTYLFLYSLFHYTLSFFLLFNIAFNYALTILTSPGNPPRESDYSEERLFEFKSIKTIKRSETYRFCIHCRLPKEERTHHCQLCGTCVLKMDHHCPWVNNCVGQNNHRYFVLFLVYLWISCIYVCILSYPHVFNSGSSYIPFSMLMSFVITLTIAFALGGLLGWQIYLILSNQTTIEFLHNRTQTKKAKARGEIYKNPYNIGILQNFKQFFKVSSTFNWFTFALPTLQHPGIQNKKIEPLLEIV
ncbi:hypothetical protein RB653_003333 [Dictyostelium firmibasis]|uniref:Palmitoyltransferase n=1 Tax=Dictyostelium firmibasis TaxID=79012 RepID=A0AAN7U4J4_9MYCE